MALLHEAKQTTKQVILNAVKAASEVTGKKLSLRVINYSQRGDSVVASMKLRADDASLAIEHVFATDKIPSKSEILHTITSAVTRKLAKPVMAADEDDSLDDSEGDMTPVLEPELSESGDVTDAVDDLADAVNDIQDNLEDIQEDDVTIQTENNIENHLIAECDSCSGVFISAMIKSDQRVDSIKGVCPLCGKESNQHFKWFISKLEYEDSTAFNI